MRFLLDTNVLSEPARPNPDPQVLAWLGAQSQLDLAISVLTLGEIEKGIARLPAGDRRARLEAWLGTELRQRFHGRVLPIDEAVAREWGRLYALGETSGRLIGVIDGLLLASAAIHRLTFITRNARECSDRGVSVLNPWEQDQSGKTF